MSCVSLRRCTLGLALVVTALACSREPQTDRTADELGTSEAPAPRRDGGATLAAPELEPAPPPAALVLDAPALTAEMTRPRRLSGSEPDLRAIAACGAPQPRVPIIAAVIGTDGRVESAAVRNQTDNECVDRLFVDAVSSWRFEPATLDGEPVRVSYFVTVTIHYR